MRQPDQVIKEKGKRWWGTRKHKKAEYAWGEESFKEIIRFDLNRFHRMLKKNLKNVHTHKNPPQKIL